MRATAEEKRMLEQLGRHNPLFIDYLERSYQETLEQLSRCDEKAFLPLQGKAKTLSLLLVLLRE